MVRLIVLAIGKENANTPSNMKTIPAARVHTQCRPNSRRSSPVNEGFPRVKKPSIVFAFMLHLLIEVKCNGGARNGLRWQNHRGSAMGGNIDLVQDARS